jgi:drug/metabolite transporter (DMT)-like permease
LWGATFLAIRVAVEDVPPLYMISSRYIISGAILLIALVLSRAKLPRGRELLYTALCGIICIGIGNGLLAVVEQWIPSGLAALFYATCPFWMVGLDAALPQGKRPHGISLGGLILGVLGVLYLVWPAARGEGITGHTFAGFLLLQLSGIGWTLGSLLQKRVRATVTPLVSGAVQQFAAGLAVGIPALLFERPPHAISRNSELALAYLIVFGSIIGFSGYVYILARLPVALASIYLFINPIVAVWLGWLLLQEPFGHRELIAMAIIFVGIALVRWSEGSRRTVSVLPIPASE